MARPSIERTSSTTPRLREGSALKRTYAAHTDTRRRRDTHWRTGDGIRHRARMIRATSKTKSQTPHEEFAAALTRAASRNPKRQYTVHSAEYTLSDRHNFEPRRGRDRGGRTRTALSGEARNSLGSECTNGARGSPPLSLARRSLVFVLLL